ncbi:MAG: hypothetical protein WD960_13100 [Gemmatimonadota bacterium]
MRFLFAATLLLLVLPWTLSARVCQSLLHEGQAAYVGYADALLRVGPYLEGPLKHWREPAGPAH